MRWALLAVLVSWLVPQSGLGIEVKGLYEAQVPVSGQGRAEREQAIQAALAEVLVKVSGDPGVAAVPEVREIFEHPRRYVQQYRYQTTTLTPERPETVALTQRSLWVRFDRKAVNEALWQAGLTVWERARPISLVWIAVEDGGERTLVGANERPDVRAALKAQAARRGLPIVLPLLDLQDQVNVQFADVWAGFEDKIIEASARYEADTVLVGRVLRGLGDHWRSRWVSFQDAGRVSWEAQGPLEDVLAAGMDGAADALAARFARGPADSPDRLRVLVTNVRSVGDYARALAYLQSLGPVTDARVDYVEASRIRFSIAVRGDREGLLNAVNLSDETLLAAVTEDGSGKADDSDGDALAADLVYRLLP